MKTVLAYHGTDRMDFALFDILKSEIGGARTLAAPFRRKFDSISSRWMNADDNPRFAKNPSLYFAFNQKLNVELRRLFQNLGYDGFVAREKNLAKVLVLE